MKTKTAADTAYEAAARCDGNPTRRNERLALEAATAAIAEGSDEALRAARMALQAAEYARKERR